MASIDEIKEKFNQLQGQVQKMKEEEISLKSTLSTLQSQLDAQVQELLDMTGTTSLDEATEACRKNQESLEAAKEELSKSLDGYLATLGAQEEGAL